MIVLMITFRCVNVFLNLFWLMITGGSVNVLFSLTGCIDLLSCCRLIEDRGIESAVKIYVSFDRKMIGKHPPPFTEQHLENIFRVPPARRAGQTGLKPCADAKGQHAKQNQEKWGAFHPSVRVLRRNASQAAVRNAATQTAQYPVAANTTDQGIKGWS